MSTPAVDVAVIGRGMIGSAAARHLAESGVSTALIGPGEPSDRRTSQGPFSSHPDEGRITRLAGRTPVWSSLAARSIERYADIENRSGILFHAAVGLALVSPNLDTWIETGTAEGSNIRRVEADWLQASTGITVTNGLPMGFEEAPAGYINPRRLVEAQTKLAGMAGAQVVFEAVQKLTRTASGFELAGSWGSLAASQVLLATGAFGRELLGEELVVERRARTVLLAETDQSEPIPSLILTQPPDDRLEDIYWVPPVMFPDGHRYLKIGGALFEDRTIATAEDLVEWFHTDGYDHEIEALEVSLRGLLPNTAFTSFRSTPCVVSGTPSGHPYIGYVDDQLAVALGGNGSAGKSSDEIGRLAASLLTARSWIDDLDQSSFTPQFG